MRTLPLFALLAACADAEPDVLSFDDAEDAEALDWTAPSSDVPLPPPVAPLNLEHAAMVGAPIELTVAGVPPGTSVTMLASLSGTGVGPCHPATGICVDLLAPRVLGTRAADGNGEAHFSVDPPGAGWAAFQAAIPAAGGTTPAIDVPIADVQHTWAYDQLLVEVDNGESGYAFGMAETDSPFGWFGEDCWSYGACHPFGSSMVLTSVHNDVGGPGINYVFPGVTTLFYEIHDTAITYYLEGDDTGDCFAWGHDPSYYPDCVWLN